MSKTPTWRLLVSGHAAGLVTAALRVAGSGGDEDDCREVHWVSGSGPGRKRIRLNRKTPAPRGFGYSISATSVEEIASCGTLWCFLC